MHEGGGMADEEEAAGLLTGKKVLTGVVPVKTCGRISALLVIAFVSSCAVVGILYGGRGMDLLVVGTQPTRAREGRSIHI